MTKTELFRRRIAPVLFGVVIALMARKSCHEGERAKATFVLELGEMKADATAVDAELWMGGDMLAELHRHALDGHTIGTPKFDAMVQGEDGELRVDVTRAAGAPVHVVRHVHVEDGATVTVKLAAPSAAP